LAAASDSEEEKDEPAENHEKLTDIVDCKDYITSL
jgi:hypothetical protein